MATIPVPFPLKYPNLFKQWHPTKNDGLDPFRISYGSGKKVWWLCQKTNCKEKCKHEYQAVISNVSRGKSCPYCADHPRKVCIHNSIQMTHPEIAKYWHPRKNGHLNPSDISAGSGLKVWWLCPKVCPQGCEHAYQQSVVVRISLINKDHCSYCAGLQCCEHTSLLATYPKIMEEWDYIKNTLNPIKISPHNSQKVWWKCKKGHSFETRITNRVHWNYGCSSCIRKTETVVYDFILSHYPDAIREFKIASCKDKMYLPFDICIPSLKTIIEVDGEQHFKQISNWQSPLITLEKDIFKMKKAEEAGYRVIRLPQRDISETFLTGELLKEIQSDSSDHCFLSEDNDKYNKHIEVLTS